MTGEMVDDIRVAARRALTLAGLACTLVLSGCGGASTPGIVKVYFCTTASMPDCKANATRTQERAVTLLLRRNTHVSRVTFVSKSAAWKRFKKRSVIPAPRGLGNPLPDMLSVTVQSVDQAAALGAAMCKAQYAGVEHCPSWGLGDSGGVQWRSNLGHRLR